MNDTVNRPDYQGVTLSVEQLDAIADRVLARLVDAIAKT